MVEALLQIEDLSVRFHTRSGTARAVDGVSLSLEPGETLGLVGESGCGKSVTALGILGLIPSPPGRVHRGRILFDGRDLLTMGDEELRRARSRDIAMIFQEPMTALNPVLSIGRQVAEPLMVRRGYSKKKARAAALDWLKRVRIPSPEQRFREYPHRLSGGMRQRVMIAMAMVRRPRLLIADEPTTALDVSTQARILILMNQLKEELGMATLLITHDLGVVAQMASRIMVIYAGQVMETADIDDLFQRPAHPYTRGLLRSTPRPGAGRLSAIPGTAPAATRVFTGCRFAERCPNVFTRCQSEAPALFPIRAGHSARCWLNHHPEQGSAP